MNTDLMSLFDADEATVRKVLSETLAGADDGGSRRGMERFLVGLGLGFIPFGIGLALVIRGGILHMDNKA